MGWQLWAAVSAVAAGATSALAKAGLEEVPSNLANTIRTAIVLCLSVGVLWWSGEYQQTATLNGRASTFLALSALATAISWVAFFKALSLGNATAVTAIDKASVAVTMLLAVTLLGDKIGWKSGVGVALVVGGALLVSSE
jgi:transporter family protein